GYVAACEREVIRSATDKPFQTRKRSIICVATCSRRLMPSMAAYQSCHAGRQAAGSHFWAWLLCRSRRSESCSWTSCGGWRKALMLGVSAHPNSDRAATAAPRALVSGVHLHHIGLQRGLALRPAVEHVSARIFLDRDAIRFSHDRHLIDDQDRGHERA